MANVNKMVLDGNLFKDTIMGIDLGTTNSAVAIYTGGTVPQLAPMGTNGRTTLQSCVRWDGGDKFTVGPEAYAERYNENVVYSIKRIMGTDKTVTLKHPDTGEKRDFTPVQISAEILRALKEKVQSSYPGVYRCIITVPAYFNQRQIEDTIQASKLAGLDCVQILKEPTSASYIYSNLGYARDGSILIYDLGGGTFDITVMSFLKKSSIPSKVVSTLKRLYKIDVEAANQSDSSLYYCRVLGTYGDTMLGGDDVDKEFASNVIGSADLSKSEFEELVLRCEKFKKGSAEAADVNVGGQLLHLTREQLREATRTVFDKTLELLHQIPKEQLDQVKTIVLVGGSTKSQYIVEFLEHEFPGKEISRVLDPDATVALGAGAVAQDLQEGRSAPYQDVLPMAIGILDSETSVDICVPANTALPYAISRTYYTMHDNQEAVSIDVYQGNSKKPEDCTYLGKLRVPGLPPRPAGDTAVVVSFLLSAEGRLTITTEVDGVSEPRELVVESIFSVNSQSSEQEEFKDIVFFDDFERSCAPAIKQHPEVAQWLMDRRDAIESGNRELAEELEFKVLEVM